MKAAGHSYSIGIPAMGNKVLESVRVGFGEWKLVRIPLGDDFREFERRVEQELRIHDLRHQPPFSSLCGLKALGLAEYDLLWRLKYWLFPEAQHQEAASHQHRHDGDKQIVISSVGIKDQPRQRRSHASTEADQSRNRTEKQALIGDAEISCRQYREDVHFSSEGQANDATDQESR